MTAKKYPTLSSRQVSFIKANASKLSDLIEPGEPWVSVDAPPHYQNRVAVLERYGVIQCVGTVSEDSVKKKLWETTPPAWSAIQKSLSRSEALPCGHRGFTNVGEGVYDCLTCGESCTRSELPVV